MAEINDRLIVSLEANVSKLEDGLNKAIAKMNATDRAVYGASSRIKKTIDGANDNWAKMFGNADPGKALERVFDRSRLAVLEAGSSQLRVFGSGLEPLGPLGVAAAAGIAAFAAAMVRTSAAVDFGAEVAKLSKEVGVSTDFIQEFNHAALQTDVPVKSADDALKALNVSLGNVQNNLGKKQILNAFKDAFGIDSTNQLKTYLATFKNAGDLFPVLADKIRAAGDAAQQASLAKRLGIEELLPLIQAGADGFRGLAKEAEQLGLVMDGSLVHQSEEAKHKLTEIDELMKTRANITFAEFAGTLITVKKALQDVEFWGLRALAALTGTTSKQQRIQDDVAMLRDQARWYANPIGAPPDSVMMGVKPQDILAQVRKDVAEVKAERAATEAAAPKSAYKAPPPSVGATAKKKAPEDRSKEALAQAMADELSAHIALLNETLSQVHELAQQNAIAAKITKAELDKVDEERKKKDTAARDAKNIDAPTKKLILAANEQAAADQKATITAKANLAARERELAARHKIVEQADKLATLDASTLSITAGMADTLAERRTLEARALAMQQEQERRDLKAEYDQKILAGDATGADRTAAEAALSRNQGAARGALAQQNEGPLDQYLRSIKDVDATIQTEAVQAFQNLASGLADAIVNAKSFGDVIKSVFRQLLADIIKRIVEQNLAGPITGLFKGILGFAGGTDYAPGGLAMVGEHGRELVNLPRGAQVIPNHRLSDLMGGGQAKGIQLNVTVYADGAIPREEIETMVRRGSVQAVRLAAGLSAKSAAGQQHLGLTGVGVSS